MRNSIYLSKINFAIENSIVIWKKWNVFTATDMLVLMVNFFNYKIIIINHVSQLREMFVLRNIKIVS